MNADELCRKFQMLRDQISHGPLKNVLFSGLQPCWDNVERFTKSDIVFMALLGDEDARSTLDELLAFYRGDLHPKLDGLVGNVAADYGLVASMEWGNALATYQKAAVALSGFSTQPCKDVSIARARAAEFWENLDVIKMFMVNLKKEFSTYFLRWDSKLLRRDTCAG